MDSGETAGFDAAATRGRGMPKAKPDQNTQWVACAAANAALEALCCNLAAYLAETPGGAATVRRLMEAAVATAGDGSNWTDLEASQFDADRARSIELEMLADSFARLRKVALHEL